MASAKRMICLFEQAASTLSEKEDRDTEDFSAFNFGSQPGS